VLPNCAPGQGAPSRAQRVKGSWQRAAGRNITHSPSVLALPVAENSRACPVRTGGAKARRFPVPALKTTVPASQSLPHRRLLNVYKGEHPPIHHHRALVTPIHRPHLRRLAVPALRIPHSAFRLLRAYACCLVHCVRPDPHDCSG
jgi:hypothetical protein